MSNYVELIHARWGGELSLIQELEDLARHLPFWLRPIWKGLISWLKPHIRRAKIAQTMAEVDRQAKEIGDNWAAAERHEQVQRAVAKAQAEHPEAKVSVHHVASHPTDAIVVQHPPDPTDAAQVALGFGALEIKASYETE